jgi:hypothetical protein
VLYTFSFNGRGISIKHVSEIWRYISGERRWACSNCCNIWKQERINGDCVRISLAITGSHAGPTAARNLKLATATNGSIDRDFVLPVDYVRRPDVCVYGRTRLTACIKQRYVVLETGAEARSRHLSQVAAGAWLRGRLSPVTTAGPVDEDMDMEASGRRG